MEPVKKFSILIMGIVLFSSMTMLIVGCGQKAQNEQGMGTAKQGMSFPDTTAASLWSYLQNADYQKNWKMWPGKSAFYPGQEPHGALLTNYVNDIAYNGIEAKNGMLPDHSIIVKENYKPDSTLDSYTVMYMVKGYNPAGGDWFWARFTPNGRVRLAGKGGMCLGCHEKQKANDYIWTASLK